MLKQLSQILQKDYGVSEEVLLEAEQARIDMNAALADVLLKKQLVTEQQLLEAYGRIYGYPLIPRITVDDFDTAFTRQITIQFLKKYLMVPIQTLQPIPGFDHKVAVPGENDDTMRRLIAIHDPTAVQPLDDLIRILGWDDAALVLSTREAILSLINTAYDSSRDTAQQLVEDMSENIDIISEIEETADLLDDTSDAPIIKLVNHIISQSVKSGASDIHIEPYQHNFKIRYRIDGILYDLLIPPKWMQAPLISRIKVMAKMNIAEKRLPQDGRFEVKIGDQDVDLRVSTIPITHGERLVLRLLNKSSSLLKMSDLGLNPDQRKVIERLIHSSHGIILVTGPTGSGKTTTLYAILSKINSPDINIITIEDPVEYQLKGIGQIQVNPKIELTFARGLRSIVRQDPDVILIGEMRDQETAEIGVQSALTGHLVFSTLHTNDSATAITRLIDIGVEPFLISSTVIAVIAQRLIRVLCEDCKEAYLPDEDTLTRLGILPDCAEMPAIYRAKGCNRCLNSGYRGRLGIYEIMLLNDSLQNMIMKTHDSHQIKSEAIRQGMTTLYQDGINKVLCGTTTVEEVLRVTQN
ncbi:MAG: type II secretion system protein GspE [Desulfobacteraceae bacterium]|jgi:general secretion pathway protein E|nr:MAG: type II secretion system protein GspE [Desulfobacteraceae bacterium]